MPTAHTGDVWYCESNTGCEERERCNRPCVYNSRRVLEFKGPTKVENQFAPDAALIAMCEQLLVDAKSGKLRALAFSVVHHDNLTPSGEINWDFYATAGAGLALGESIARLRHRWDVKRDESK